jgi:hypothetical protein
MGLCVGLPRRNVLPGGWRATLGRGFGVGIAGPRAAELFTVFFFILHAAEMDALKNRKHWYKMDVHILLDMVVHH